MVRPRLLFSAQLSHHAMGLTSSWHSLLGTDAVQRDAMVEGTQETQARAGNQSRHIQSVKLANQRRPTEQQQTAMRAHKNQALDTDVQRCPSVQSTAVASLRIILNSPERHHYLMPPTSNSTTTTASFSHINHKTRTALTEHSYQARHTTTSQFCLQLCHLGRVLEHICVTSHVTYVLGLCHVPYSHIFLHEHATLCPVDWFTC